MIGVCVWNKYGSIEQNNEIYFFCRFVYAFLHANLRKYSTDLNAILLLCFIYISSYTKKIIYKIFYSTKLLRFLFHLPLKNIGTESS